YKSRYIQYSLQPQLFFETKELDWLYRKIENVTNIKLNWNKLESNSKKYGHRNAYLTAIMPTATTSNMIQQSPSIEPYTSVIFSRSNQAGEFVMFNPVFIEKSKELSLWGNEFKNLIIENGGDIPS